MMSLLPILLSAWLAEMDRPQRLLDQSLGLSLYPEQLLLPNIMDRLNPTMTDRAILEMYYRPLAQLMRRGQLGTSTLTMDKGMFKAILDVQQFKPEEISVKLVDRCVVVEAKHDESRDEHGLISRQFVRRYLLPEQVDEDKLSSTISSDGILTITAPMKPSEGKPNERTIQIEQTGKPAILTETQDATRTGTDTTTTTTTAASEEQQTATQESNTREEMTANSEQEKPEK